MMIRFGSYRTPAKWFLNGSVSRHDETIFFSRSHSHPHDDMRGRVLLPALLGGTLRATGLALNPVLCAQAIQDPAALFSKVSPFALEHLERVGSQAKSIQTAKQVL